MDLPIYLPPSFSFSMSKIPIYKYVGNVDITVSNNYSTAYWKSILKTHQGSRDSFSFPLSPPHDP